MSRSRSHLIAIVALVVLAAGCANTGAASRQSPSVSPRAVPTVWLVHRPGPTPPEFPTVGPGAAGLSCRLPVAFATGPVDTQPAEGRPGFVQFPEGRVTIAYSCVVRLDLRTGQTQVWLVTPGRQIDIVGVDQAGRPLVMVRNGLGAELQLSAPGQWQTYPVPQAATHAGLANAYPNGISDANGIWIEDADAIYLFDQQQG